jgi:outer membrane protein assembly factor BamD
MTLAHFSRILVLMLCCILAACNTKGEPKDPYLDKSAKEIYRIGTKALNKEHYGKAVEAYESLERQYPFGEYTEQTQLNLIYAHYRFNELPAAMRSADNFIKLHPRSPHLDYAYYMRGMIKSAESVGFIAQFLPIDLSQRDTGYGEAAFVNFQEFIQAFPDSPYAPDARQRMIALRNDLAQENIHIARYYMRRGAYLGAANRAQLVVEHFPQTPAVNQALEIMVKAYTALDMKEQAKDAQEVLALNHVK